MFVYKILKIMTKKLEKRGRKLGMEGWMMINAKSRDFFYSEKPDKDLTAIACFYNRKITTERLIAVTTKKEEPKATQITKVTFL